MIRTNLLTAMSKNFGTHTKVRINKSLSVTRFTFQTFFLICLFFSSEVFSQSFIQIRQKAISKEISSDFAYNTLGATTSNFKTTAL